MNIINYDIEFAKALIGLSSEQTILSKTSLKNIKTSEDLTKIKNIFFTILYHLPLSSLVNLSMTCKSFRIIVQNPDLWNPYVNLMASTVNYLKNKDPFEKKNDLYNGIPSRNDDSYLTFKPYVIEQMRFIMDRVKNDDQSKVYVIDHCWLLLEDPKILNLMVNTLFLPPEHVKSPIDEKKDKSLSRN